MDVRRLRPPAFVWSNAAPLLPLPRWLVAVRTGAAVAMALPCVALGAIAGSAMAVLREWLALAAVVLGVVLVARVAAAVQRWRLGLSDLLELTSAARSVFLLACSFLPADASADIAAHAQFVADLKRLLLAFVALALQDCHDPDELPADQLRALLGDDSQELDELRRSSERNAPRAAAVELWLRMRIARACGVSDQGSSGTGLLLPHAGVVVELQRVVATLPTLYANAVRAWSEPPVWGCVTAYTPRLIFAFLALYAAGHALEMPFLVALLCVGSWGLALFGLDALALAIETRHLRWHQQQEDEDAESDPLETPLLRLQDELDAAAHALFRSNGGLVHWERWNRSVPPRPRWRRTHPASIPRSTSSIAPASPRRRSPGTSRAPGSPGSGGGGGGDGLRKPSLKHMLDMITTSSSSTPPPLSTTTSVAATAAERRPLLQQPAARYDLFLRGEDERSGSADDSDATDVDEDADENAGIDSSV